MKPVKHLPKPPKRNRLLDEVRNARTQGRLIPFPLYSMGEAPEGIHTRDVLKDSRLLAETAKNGQRRYGLPYLLTPMDLSVHQETLGHVASHPHSFRRYQENGRGSVEPTIGGIETALGSLPNHPKSFENTAIGDHLNAHKILRDEHPDVLRVGYVPAPFTTMNQIGGDSKVLMGTMMPDEAHNHLERYSEDLARNHARALVDGGANGVIILDPSSTGPLLSPQQFREHVQPGLRRMVGDIHKKGAFSVVHICGESGGRIREMYETGASAISIDSNVDLKQALQEVKKFNDEHPTRPPVLVMGNLDSKNMHMWDEKRTREETQKMLANAKGYEDIFVPATACEILGETPHKNIRAFVNTVNAHKITA